MIFKFFGHFIGKSITAGIAGIAFAILYTIQFSKLEYLWEAPSTHMTIGTPIAIVMLVLSVPLFFVWGFISTFLIERWVQTKKPSWNLLGVKCILYVLLSLLISGGLYVFANDVDWFIPLTGSMILFCLVETFFNGRIDKIHSKLEKAQEVHTENQAS
ncbi:hypothetical protein [Hazenella coriacea]|uniref:Uncharacterized protein n=1 Tax=Hazenella coriacea TaxID=1179467 RepID=A0A4R3L9E6_9BACL|nr:hypothetical protein [Hazenella coriacea]TCS95730.1 hypothetical protein EDD58_102308 [Hazenella coriacea]